MYGLIAIYFIHNMQESVWMEGFNLSKIWKKFKASRLLNLRLFLANVFKFLYIFGKAELNFYIKYLI